MARIVAALDLGSNTLKLTVARLGDPLEVLAERSEITRVGEKLDQNGVLLGAAMDRTMAGLARLVGEARALGAETLRAVATAGLRGAGNAGDLLDRIRRELGLEVEIIDGLREAELSFRAPASRFGPGPVLVIDLGGRSTELAFGTGGQLVDRVSLEIGSVRLTDRHVRHDPPTPEELAFVRQDVRAALDAARVPRRRPEVTVVGVSGTVLGVLGASLGLDDMDEVVRRASTHPLSVEEVERVALALAAKTTAERVLGDVIPMGRADVIPAGALVLAETLRRIGAAELRASHEGLRHGLLFELRGGDAPNSDYAAPGPSFPTE